MTTFVDTSALYAVVDKDDANHAAAAAAWRQLLTEPAHLVTHNYVLIETCALVQNRLGVSAVRTVHEDLAPIMQIEWISSEQHGTAVEMAVTAARKKLSVVDCVSFVVMRHLGIAVAFCFDRHFREQGFRMLP